MEKVFALLATLCCVNMFFCGAKALATQTQITTTATTSNHKKANFDIDARANVEPKFKLGRQLADGDDLPSNAIDDTFVGFDDYDDGDKYNYPTNYDVQPQLDARSSLSTQIDVGAELRWLSWRPKIGSVSDFAASSTS